VQCNDDLLSIRRGGQRLDQRRLTVKDAARPANRPSCISPSTPASLITAPPWGKVAAQQPQPAGPRERRRQRMDDFAVRGGRPKPGDLLRECLSSAG
jgi:hypothetical protein